MPFMARILFVWELGKGFGHLAPYLDFVKGLRKRNHQVVFAARDVGNTEKIFGNDGVPIVQAPIMMHNIPNPYRIQYNFSQLLHNTGMGELRSLFGLVKAWRHVYQYTQPDLVLFDHSPIAMLAAKAYPWKRIISGSGFLIPPPGQPLPMMRYWQEYDQERLAKEEGRLLAGMNRVLEILKVAPLQSVSQLYEGDDQFHLGFKELDHYPQRPNEVAYLGMFSPPGHGVAPVWPEGGKRKVFAYLHPYKQIPALLKTLAAGNISSIIYAPEVQQAIKKKFQNERMLFSPKPLDVRRVAAECDVAITNGTFGTTAAFLLYGKPVLAIPTNLERVMVVRRVVGLGAGIGVQPNQPEKLRPALRALFSSDRFVKAARAFGEKYQHLNLEWQTQQMLERIERLLPAGKPATAPASPVSATVNAPPGFAAEDAVAGPERAEEPEQALGGPAMDPAPRPSGGRKSRRHKRHK